MTQSEKKIKELELINSKLKIFHAELDDQTDKMLQKYKSLKEGLFAFLEIEQANAHILIEATKEHDIVKYNLSKKKLDNMQLVWDEYNKQIGKAELVSLLKKEIETVFKVADSDDSDESDFENETQ